MRSKRRLVAKARAIQNQGRTTIKILPAAMLAVALLVVACGSEQAESPADAADPTESLHPLNYFPESGVLANKATYFWRANLTEGPYQACRIKRCEHE